MDNLIDLTSLPSMRHKVSSVLNKSSEFSGKNMFDANNNNCWNSEQGGNQYIMIDFGEIVVPRLLNITFQGGFVGQNGIIEVGSDLSCMSMLDKLDHITDSNNKQTFYINVIASEGSAVAGRYFKLTFPSSTDFYGRVIIYHLSVFGDRS